MRDERCRGMTRWCGADWPLPVTLLAREARPSSLKGGQREEIGRTGAAQSRLCGPPSWLARLARPPSREDREKFCPPFKGDGRVRDERCRGMTPLLLAGTALRLPPGPSSLKGGPKNLSPFQGGRQSEGRTMQGDDTLVARSRACAGHPPGSRGSPVLPQGRDREKRSDALVRRRLAFAGHPPGSQDPPCALRLPPTAYRLPYPESIPVCRMSSVLDVEA